jgi:hypothetical protein
MNISNPFASEDVHGFHAIVAVRHVEFDIETAPGLFRPGRPTVEMPLELRDGSPVVEHRLVVRGVFDHSALHLFSRFSFKDL